VKGKEIGDLRPKRRLDGRTLCILRVRFCSSEEGERVEGAENVQRVVGGGCCSNDEDDEAGREQGASRPRGGGRRGDELIFSD
jgi:hypothetical protein